MKRRLALSASGITMICLAGLAAVPMLGCFGRAGNTGPAPLPPQLVGRPAFTGEDPSGTWLAEGDFLGDPSVHRIRVVPSDQVFAISRSDVGSGGGITLFLGSIEARL